MFCVYIPTLLLLVPDLKKVLKSRGLNTTGNKNELVERLQAALKTNERASNESVDDLDEDLLNVGSGYFQTKVGIYLGFRKTTMTIWKPRSL